MEELESTLLAVEPLEAKRRGDHWLQKSATLNHAGGELCAKHLDAGMAYADADRQPDVLALYVKSRSALRVAGLFYELHDILDKQPGLRREDVLNHGD